MDYHTLLLSNSTLGLLPLVIQTQAAILLAITVIVLLIISFYISGAEIAFFSLGFRDVNLLKTKQDSSWKRIATLLEQPRILLASLGIASTLVNIAIIILLNLLIDESGLFAEGVWWQTMLVLGLKVALISFLLILFGKILPKVRATQNNLRFAYEASYLVELLYYLFNRSAARLLAFSDRVERFVGGGRSRAFSHKQLEEAIRSTVHQVGEQRILSGIYKFGLTTVKQVMRTRLDVSGLPFELGFGELKKKVRDLHYSRLPVYRESLDDIAGILHVKDLLPYLHEGDGFDWRGLLRPPFFVHEQKYIEDLLQEFQGRHIHFAVVVDEFGGTSGIVTLEDILEEITGEIRDEFDEEESTNRKLDDNTFVFDGGIMLNDMCSLMDIPFDTFTPLKGESDSLAGLLLEVAGKIPAANDVITLEDFEFEVLEVERNRIRKVKVHIRR